MESIDLAIKLLRAQGQVHPAELEQAVSGLQHLKEKLQANRATAGVVPGVECQTV